MDTTSCRVVEERPPVLLRSTLKRDGKIIPLYDNLENYPSPFPAQNPNRTTLATKNCPSIAPNSPSNTRQTCHSQPNTPAKYRRCASDPDVKLYSVRPAQSETRLLNSNPTKFCHKQSFSAKLKRVFSRSKEMDNSPRASSELSDEVTRRHSCVDGKNDEVIQNQHQRLSFASTSTGYSSARSSVRSTAHNGEFTEEIESDMLAAVLRPLLKDNEALSSPKKVALLNSGQTTYLDRLAMELLDTERAYVNDLSAIIQGYLNYLLDRRDELAITAVDICQLFGNIEQVFEFNRNFYLRLDACRLDLLQMAQCFIDQQEGFQVYAQYCTQYPKMVTVLSGLCQKPRVRQVLEERQTILGHSLPVGPYLLKPIQRVLKYHLFLENTLRNWDHSKLMEVTKLKKALGCMTERAQSINEVKKREEHAARVLEIQSILSSWKTDQCQDLTQYGDLMLEASFRLTGTKTVRQLFLFEEMLLITKEKSDGMLQCKDFIMCSNLMLVESVSGDQLAFQVLSFDNPKIQYTLQSRSLDQKRQWTHEIKRLMLEHYNVEIPNRAKQIVMTLATPKVDKRQMSSLRPKSAGKRGNPVPKYLEKRRKSADASAELRILRRNTPRSASTTDLVQTDSFQTPTHSLAPKEKTRSTGRIEDFFEQRRQSAEQRPINNVNRFHLLRLRKNKRQNSIENNNEMKRRYFESNELPSTLPCGSDTKESTVDDKRASGTSSSGDSAYESNGNHKDFTQEMHDLLLDSDNFTKAIDDVRKEGSDTEIARSWLDIENTFADLWAELREFSIDDKSTKSSTPSRSGAGKFPIPENSPIVNERSSSKEAIERLNELVGRKCNNNNNGQLKVPIELGTPTERIRPKRPQGSPLKTKTKSLGNLSSDGQKAKFQLDDDLHTDDEDSAGSFYDTLFEWDLERKLDALRFEGGANVFTDADDEWPDLLSEANQRLKEAELEPLRHLVNIRESVKHWEANIGKKKTKINNNDDEIAASDNLGVVHAMVKQWEVTDQSCHL